MDSAWWAQYGLEAKEVFKGRLCSISPVDGVERILFAHSKNSGAGAISLAAHFGASRIILIGYDCQKTGGKAHWHEDHPGRLGNAGSLHRWPEQFEAVKKTLNGAYVVNCSRETALECFSRNELDTELKNKPVIFVEGMHGLGDNLHQRGVVRELKKDYTVWVDTPWPCLYHDLDVRLTSKGTRLRTQAKNAQREADRFDSKPPSNAKRLKVSYPPSMVREHGSVYAAMSAQCNVPMGDFSLPVPAEWLDRADDLIASWHTTKPILIYRPLVERKEWGGCHTRNPDIEAYHALIESVRERFFVVSVADLVPDVEWTVCKPIQADAAFHSGELDIEILTGLVKRSALVFTSPGFAVILAQSVGTPVVGVFGGYENSQSFTPGEKYAPCLWVDPIVPCQCFSHTHKCKKAIDVPKWLPLLDEFAQRAI